MLIPAGLSPIWAEFVLVQPLSEHLVAVPVAKVDYTSGLIKLANSGRFTREADGKISKLQLNVSPHMEGNALNADGIPNHRVTLMHHSRNFELTNLEYFPDLLELDVSGSLITDAGLEHLKPLTTLKKLAITNTQLTKAGMSEFRKTHPACIVVGQPIDPNAIATP